MRKHLRAILILAVAVLPGCVAEPDRPPNVVLILADDLGWSDLAVQGSGYYRTPHLDRLAARGMRFTNAYANAPNCAPTRASLLSGLYTPRHGVYTVGDPWRGPRAQRRLTPADNRTDLDTAFVTLAEALRTAGYATAHMGKWHLGRPGEAGPRAQGFDLNVGGTQAGAPPTYFSPYGIPTLEDGPDGEYLTDRLTDEAVRFIEAHRDTTFFLYLAHFAVHTPIQAPDSVAARYAGRTPWHGQSDTTYAAMIERLDAGVGRVLEALDAQGLTDDTVVLFFSDNGGLGGYASAGLPESRNVTDNHPLKGGKGQLYEGGIRVPLFVAWPGRVPAGAVSDEPVIGLDLYPTLLDLAGAQSTGPDRLDGRSLRPLWEGEESLGRDALYWFFPAYLQAYGPGGLRTAPAAAVREGPLKLIWFFEDDRVELYHLSVDTGETRDLSATRPEEAAALKERLRRWMETVDAPLPQPNPAYEGQES